MKPMDHIVFMGAALCGLAIGEDAFALAFALVYAAKWIVAECVEVGGFAATIVAIIMCLTGMAVLLALTVSILGWACGCTIFGGSFLWAYWFEKSRQ